MPDEAVDGLHVKVWSFTLDGKTIADPHWQEIIKPFLDQEITFRDMQKLTEALTAYERKNGFILNKVVLPAQDLSDGSLDLHLVEGYVDKIEYQGDKSLANELVKGYLEPLLTAHPLTQEVYERAILLVDDLPGMVVQATLVASQENKEASTLVVKLSQQHYGLSMDTNNAGTKTSGPWQYTLNGTLNNLLGLNEALTLGWAEAPSSSAMRMNSFSFNKPLGSEGWKLNFSGSKSVTHPSSNLRSLNSKGVSESFSVAGAYPVIRSRYKTLTTQAGITVKSSTNKTRLSNTKTTDKTRILFGSGSFDFSDTWNGQNIFSVGLFKGVHGLGATRENSSLKTRSRGRVDFLKATMMAMRTQMLPYDFQLKGVVNGQVSPHSLLSGERFKVGGAPDNFTYPNAAYTGDQGYESKVELGYVISKALGTNYIMPYTYFAHGEVWNRHRESGEFKSRTINGYSVGVRSMLIDNLNFYAEYAVPLKKQIQATTYNTKMNFGLSYSISLD